MSKRLSRITFFCKDKNGYHRTVNAYPDQDIHSPSNVFLPEGYVIDHIEMGGSDHVWEILEKREKKWLEVTRNKEIDDSLEILKSNE